MASAVTIDLPLSPRYQGAWGEVAARLQSRQLVNLHFAVAVLTTGSLVVGLLDKVDPQLWATILSFGLVAFAWVYALWIRHNDAILGLLGAFGKQCELLADPKNELGVPGWFRDDQQWIVLARGYRELSDWAGMILAVLASAPSFVVGYWQVEINRPLGLALVAAGTVGVSAAVVLYRNKHLRNRIANGRFEQTPAGWRFSI